MEFDFFQLKSALCIDENYNFDYLKDLYQHSIDFKYDKDFKNLTEMFVILENNGLKTSRIQRDKNISHEWFYNLIETETNESAQLKSETKEYTNSDYSEDKNNNEYQEIYLAPLSKDCCMQYQVEYVKVLINYLISFNASNENEQEKSLYSHLKKTFPNFECLDERIRNIPSWFANCSDLSILSFNKSFSALKELFRRSVFNIIDNNLFNYDSLLVLSLFGQLFLYMLAQESEIPHLETFPCMATQIAICLYYRKSLREGFSLIQKGLSIKTPHEKALAYHYFAVLAMDLGNLQLAYDIYLSWLQQKYVGNIAQYITDSYFSKKGEKAYRNSPTGNNMRALVFGNLGYLCARISNTYELSSSQEKFFYRMSVKYKQAVYELRPEYWYSYVSYGQALRRDLHFQLDNDQEMQNHINMIKNSIELFEKAEEYLPYNNAYPSLFAYRQYCRALMELIMFEVCKTNEVKLNNSQLQQYYKSLISIAEKYKKVDASLPSNDYDLHDELRFRNDLLPVLHFYGRRASSALEIQIHILLLSIRQIATIMEVFLQRREYISINYRRRTDEEEYDRSETRQIAYYTTLKNFQHIFDELYLEDDMVLPKIDKDKKKPNTKNCLTVMNAKYMNDPNEGVVLLTELTRNLNNNMLFSGKTAVGFNRSIFNEYFVFLKSFTEQIDKLTMWNRYANDYDREGKNSNGCCVFVSPECFVNNVKYSLSGRELTDRNEDDFRLYRVVYLSSIGDITKERNPGLNSNVYLLYKNLRELMKQLNDCLNAISKKHPKKIDFLNKIVEKSLSESLKKVIFLFKYEDYSDEQESRLILFRDKEHQEDIRIIDGDFPKLAINPFFQIFVKGIILGPNVRSPEKWEPYFQYQLNEMWKKDSSGSEKADSSNKKFFIKQSDIKYYT